ncbi:MAG: hypothetical protein HC837_06865 [Chloroflexaceae bacterium]|nr:hypothetical protein [Chloroflexaceae bacterium]
MVKQRHLGTSIVVLLTVVLIASVYMVSVGAEDRNYDSTQDGPRDPAEVPDAPEVVLTSAQSPLMVARFDDTTDLSTWEQVQHTPFPYEYGVWQADSGKLYMSGAVEGTSFEQTMLLEPTVASSNALIAGYVYPQGAPVVGLVFAATEDGYCTFRAFRQALDADEATSEPSVNYMIECFDAATEDYQTWCENTTTPGFDTDAWREMRVEINGTQVVASFDGQPVCEVANLQPAGGRSDLSGLAGFYTIAIGDTLFDNLTIAE